MPALARPRPPSPALARPRWLPLALALVVAALPWSHRELDAQAGPATAQPAPDVEVGVAVSSPDVQPGGRVALVLEWSRRDGVGLDAVLGELIWNPAALRYVGQELVGETYTEINDAGADGGSLVMLSLNPWGLQPRPAVLVFEVLAPGYTEGLRFEPREAAHRDQQVPFTPERGLRSRGAVAVERGVPVPAAPSRNSEAWMARWEARAAAERSPGREAFGPVRWEPASRGRSLLAGSAWRMGLERAPAFAGVLAHHASAGARGLAQPTDEGSGKWAEPAAQSCAATPCYGDVDGNGAVNVLDVGHVSNWNLENCRLGICPVGIGGAPIHFFPPNIALRANVGPVNLPGLGGESDGLPPGHFAGCAPPVLNVVDVLEISHASVQNGLNTVAGNPVPADAGSHPRCPQLLARTDGDQLNAEGTERRNLCLSVALAPGLATECGDLRVTYPFPTVRTMNKGRTMAWTYSTAHARPYPIVQAQLRQPFEIPDSVRITLLVRVDTSAASWTTVAYRAESTAISDTTATGWQAGKLGTIAMGFEAADHGLATGVYAYRLRVENVYPDTVARVEMPGELVVVNRANSPYLPGGWIAGLESLHPLQDGRILRVGGDGSTTLYRTPTDGIRTPAASALVDRPDTLYFAGGLYRRPLHPGGGEVLYDSLGRHIRTNDRLGHQTTFNYDASSQLTSVRFPGPLPTGVSDHVRFNYPSGFGFQAYVQGTTYQGFLLGRDMVSIRPSESSDDTVQAQTYQYNGSPALSLIHTHRFETANGLFLSRVDARGTVHDWTRERGRITRSALRLGGDSIVHLFRPSTDLPLRWAEQGPADSLGSATFLDGPRDASVGDTTLFWLDRFGRPLRVRDALGHETVVRLHAPNGGQPWPGQVARVRAPNGRITAAAYDAAEATLSSVTDSSRCNGSGCSTTRYFWSERSGSFQKLDSVAGPSGERTYYSYASGTGNVLSQRDNRPGSVVQFWYNLDQLVDSVRGPQTPPTSYQYSTFGSNLSRITSPLGFVTNFHADARGRDTLVVTPIDGVRTARSRSVYDARNRVTASVQIGPSMPGSPGGGPETPPDTMRVENHYDPESNLVRVTRRASRSDSIVTQTTFDRAHRMTAKYEEAAVDSMVYDPAGNISDLILRSTVPLTATNTIRMTYDPLGRLVERVVPSVSYQAIASELDTLPYENVGGVLTIPADTSRFTYDAVGNILTATNRFARITHAYGRDGMLDTATVAVKALINDSFTLHSYQTRYSYDLSGRRTAVIRSPTDSTSYSYHPWGPLNRVTAFGGFYEHTYDNENRLTQRQGPGGLLEQLTYDGESRVVQRTDSTSGVSGMIISETITYDQRDRILTRANAANATSGVYNYSGLGSLVYSHEQLLGSAFETQWMEVDGLGNTLAFEREGAIPNLTDPEPLRFENVLYKGRVETTREVWNQPGPFVPDPPFLGNETQFEFDGRGRRDRTYLYTPRAVFTNNTYVNSGLESWSRSISKSFYGADDRLRFHQVSRADSSDTERDAPHYGVFEEYWYDALGRRVMSRSFQGGTLCVVFDRCQSHLDRFVWDGDQLLSERRWTSGYDIPALAGTAHYVHGGDLDRPLGMQINGTAVSLHYDYRGMPAEATNAAGAATSCGPFSPPSCVDVRWPAGNWTSTLESKQALSTPDWYGSLAIAQRDDTGNLYRRNRYFDPTSGQFTQPDPIGLAGGINLYGYGDGDPVNFSDPFGLCPWPPSSCFQNLANWGASRGGASGWLGLNAGALGAALFEVSSGADVENAVGAAGEGRYLAAAGFALMGTPVGKGLKGFKAGQWLTHFAKHGEKLGLANSVDYLQAANRLLAGGNGVETFTRANGDQLFYREATNEFGVLAADGTTIRTYFRPDEGREYWRRQTGGN